MPPSRGIRRVLPFALAFLLLAMQPALQARPRFKENLKKHYGDLLAHSLQDCTTCHLAKAQVADAAVFETKPPHNPFGARLKALGEELKAHGEPSGIIPRLRAAAAEDSDGDGTPNEIEILAGRRPGDESDAPSSDEVRAAAEKLRAFQRDQPSYPWEPFRPVVRPAPPEVRNAAWVRNPVDAFVAREHEAHGLTPRPEAPRHVLLRRVYLDLIGLTPKPEELRSFIEDASPDAYEKVVRRLLSSPHHGERWGRHWMDVWRYSDWAGWGNQVRDSQPHIWRWRDWIVESLNGDKTYDRMVLEMLAGDEIAPLDPSTLRATGYLVRNFKLLSREAWMQETVDHSAQAFLGLTLGCARCHDHRYDPISQKEYYQVRAVFEPYQVRLDRLPGQLDVAKDGLARVFDGSLDAKTFLFIRGDDRSPDKDHPLSAAVPEALGGAEFKPEPVALPLAASVPEKSDHVVRETLRMSEEAVAEARMKLEAALIAFVNAEKARKAAAGAEATNAEETLARAREEVELSEMDVPLSEARHAALSRTVAVERMEDDGGHEKDPEGWKRSAIEATSAQRCAALLEKRRECRAGEIALRRAKGAAQAAQTASAASTGEEKAGDKKLEEAAKKALAAVGEAEKKLSAAEKEFEKAKDALILPASPEYAKRPLKVYPASSTGRRTAFARWIAGRRNPLAARVAVNHIWLRHFGQAILPTVADFGLNGRPPTHPALLDWLAAELMEPTWSKDPTASNNPTASKNTAPWSMAQIHWLIVTSSAYRMASTPDAADLVIDADNRFLWRMNSRRLEAEIVRDGMLMASGLLDATLGGPELDQGSLLSTRRRSIYYRHAAEKQPEFLQIFDMAVPSECYERKVSVVPQQALALANNPQAIEAARALAGGLVRSLSPEAAADSTIFVRAAFEAVLARPATREEMEASVDFLMDQEKSLTERKERLTSSAGGKALTAPALRARENLVHVLFNHHDFVTVR